MTNPSIPPCPVCRVVPMLDTNNGFVYVHMCKGTRISVYHHHWVRHCRNIIGRAAVEVYGIHTLAELAARLAPDPRVAVLESIREFLALPISVPAYLSERGRDYYILDVTEYRKQILKLIAAQRGEDI